ncbi:MAG TPA: hypothetical protein VF821_10870 [Lentzea sp.]
MVIDKALANALVMKAEVYLAAGEDLARADCAEAGTLFERLNIPAEARHDC